MDAEFWHAKWAQNSIGFHEPAANPLLTAHFRHLDLKPGSRIFVPLCGKSLDIHWLLAQGYRVAGAELSELAVTQLFQELKLAPTVTPTPAGAHYAAPGIDIFVGDIFAVTRDHLGDVDAVYDRAALVALPEEMRQRYVSHVIGVTRTAPQLLISFVYDQSRMNGPPFAVDASMVEAAYQATHRPVLLHQADVAGGLKGKCPAWEYVWHLIPHG